MEKKDVVSALFISTLVVVLVISFIALLNERNLIKFGELQSSQRTIDSLKFENEKLKEQIKVLDNDMQLREDEITFWGMKYDSVSSVLYRMK
jgi:cell division protein FtsL